MRMAVIVIMMRHPMTDIMVCDTDTDMLYTEMTGIILHNIYLSHTNYPLSASHIVIAIHRVGLMAIYDKVESLKRHIKLL